MEPHKEQKKKSTYRLVIGCLLSLLITPLVAFSMVFIAYFTGTENKEFITLAMVTIPILGLACNILLAKHLTRNTGFYTVLFSAITMLGGTFWYGVVWSLLENAPFVFG